MDKNSKEYKADLQKRALEKVHRCGITDMDDLVIRACESFPWNVEDMLESPDEDVTRSLLPVSLFSV